MDVNHLKTALNYYEKHWLSQIPTKKIPHVLLVEDVPLLQKVTRFLLEELGCYVTIAGNGKTVLEHIAANKLFDLIFMDINLPDTNGIALTKYLRRQSIHAPIIALASEESVIRSICFMAGMNDFVRKPVSYKTLKKVLLEWVR